MSRPLLKDDLQFAQLDTDQLIELPRTYDNSARISRPYSTPFGSGRRLYDTYLDNTYGALWTLIKPEGPHSFTWDLVRALREGQQELEQNLRLQARGEESVEINYQVFGSRIPGVFSRGGDLCLVRDLIASGDSDALLAYSRDCIDIVYTNAVNYQQPITTISLVQGDALCGGFVAALAANVIVAERGCKMGLPEILFKKFPGMGAYQLLVRRLPPVKAEQLITSGRIHTAEEMFEMGVVDILAEPGDGEEAVWSYIKTRHRQRRGRNALRTAMRETDVLDYDALLRVAEIWVETAMQLQQTDLEVIDYLMRAQKNRHG